MHYGLLAFFSLNPLKLEFMFILWDHIMFLYDILKVIHLRTVFKVMQSLNLFLCSKGSDYECGSSSSLSARVICAEEHTLF